MKTLQLSQAQRLYYAVVYNHDIFKYDWTDDNIFAFSGLDDIEINPLLLFQRAADCGGVGVNHIKKAIVECTPFGVLNAMRKSEKGNWVNTWLCDTNNGIFNHISHKSFFDFVEWVNENIRAIGEFEFEGKKYVIVLHEDYGLAVYVDGVVMPQDDDEDNNELCEVLVKTGDFPIFYTKYGAIFLYTDETNVGGWIRECENTGGWDVYGGETREYISGGYAYINGGKVDFESFLHEETVEESEFNHANLFDIISDGYTILRDSKKVTLPKSSKDIL